MSVKKSAPRILTLKKPSSMRQCDIKHALKKLQENSLGKRAKMKKPVYLHGMH